MYSNAESNAKVRWLLLKGLGWGRRDQERRKSLMSKRVEYRLQRQAKKEFEREATPIYPRSKPAVLLLRESKRKKSLG
jgi:hypothetical protein